MFGYMAVFGAVLIWGLSYIIMKSTTTEYPQLLFQFWRYCAVTLVYAALFRRSLRAIPVRIWRMGLVQLGSSHFVLGFFSIYAVQLTTPTHVVVINSFIIGVVPLLRWLHERCKPTRQEKGAIAIAVMAIALLIGPQDQGVNIGDGLAFVGMFGYAYSIVLTDRLLSKERATVPQVSFLGIAGCALLFAAAAAVYVGINKDLNVIALSVLTSQPETLAGIAYMIVFVSLAANLLQVHGQRRLPPVAVSILFCLEPAVTVALDYALLGNKPSIRVLLCGLLLIAATVATARPIAKSGRRRKEAALDR
ncbi:DMT family transporter [Paenibacillus sacheonensis]|uniref:EamA family transporter n=1 Tax=Paenibacillus sacheonensis TaxID=742054 RepID=A0A7X5BYT8_9BACL|nr:DMT family transporter [Paenibacillus sacheonensis]MBM7567788.1 drug/metabolite transporter (DMT)-like permease [Paenibacillus sacheonensis]NBC71943.1 EamA family transporter [Paenibacillus sacheonensis]